MHINTQRKLLAHTSRMIFQTEKKEKILCIVYCTTFDIVGTSVSFVKERRGQLRNQDLGSTLAVTDFCSTCLVILSGA